MDNSLLGQPYRNAGGSVGRNDIRVYTTDRFRRHCKNPSVVTSDSSTERSRVVALNRSQFACRVRPAASCPGLIQQQFPYAIAVGLPLGGRKLAQRTR